MAEAAGAGGGATRPHLTPRAFAWASAAILMLALALRIAAALPLSMHHPDEIFQYIEQAHRLIFGYGVVTWEYRYGMRSWLLPWLLSGPMQLGAILSPASSLYLFLPKLTLVLLSLAIVWSARAIGRQISPLHSLVAMFVTAIWFELVFFAGHALTEAIATALFISAAALANNGRDRRSFVIAGILLGLTVLVRFHYAPAIGVYVLLANRLAIRDKWLPMVAGGCAALAAGAMIDLWMGQTPFAWIVENFRQNIIHDRAANYGVSGPTEYFRFIAVYWSLWIVPIMALLIIGLRRQPALCAAALANLAFHMMIGHKEYRFILLSMTIFILIAAIGSVDLLRWIEKRADKTTMPALLVAMLAFWSVASVTRAADAQMQPKWTGHQPVLDLALTMRSVPGLCGIAYHDVDPIWGSGGYSHIHRDVPLFFYEGTAADTQKLALDSAGFNVIVAPIGSSAKLPRSYIKTECRSARGGHGTTDVDTRDFCRFMRPGPCDRAVDDANRVDRLLIRHDL